MLPLSGFLLVSCACRLAGRDCCVLLRGYFKGSDLLRHRADGGHLACGFRWRTRGELRKGKASLSVASPT